MKNRKLLLIVSLVLAMTLSLGSTLAYLTDTDADVNTMVLGNVQIVQNEQERVKDADGKYTTELKEFNDGQMMLPAVYGGSIGEPERMKDLVVGNYAITLDTGVRTFPNYMDKIVTVTNMGNTDAYVRTIIAKPAGTNDVDPSDGIPDVWLHSNVLSNGDTRPENGWYWGKSKADGEWPQTYILKNVDINGALYDVSVATNINPLAPKDTTGPSLIGVYLDNDVDYDVKNKVYTAKNEAGEIVNVWDQEELKVLVVSQAVQADGFADAFVALQEAFGEVNAENVQKWFGSITEEDIGSVGGKHDSNNPPYQKVDTVEQLLNAINSGMGPTGNVTFEAGQEVVPEQYMMNNEDLSVNMNGGSFTVPSFTQNNNAKLELSNGTLTSGTATNYANIARGDEAETILTDVKLISNGGGVAAADGAKVVFNSGELAVNSASTSGRYLFYLEGEGSEITINDGVFSFSKTLNQKRAYIYAGAGTTVYVNGGTFGKASTRSGYTAGIMGTGTVVIKGGTFGFDPSAWVADGYEAVKTGDNWVVSAK